MQRTTRFPHSWIPQVLSIARIVIALLFIEHGTQKIFNFPPSEQGPMPFNIASMMGIGAVIELVGGALLLLGLGTRIVSFILAGEMAVAYWMMHAPHGAYPLQNKGELAALYCFAFLVFAVAGGGAWSLDRLFSRQRVADEPAAVPETASPANRASLM